MSIESSSNEARTPPMTASSRGCSALRVSFLQVPWFLTLVGMLVLVGALWLPFGFKKTGLMEEWIMFWGFDRGQPPLGADFMGEHVTRPFALLCHYLAYLLTPDSFVGANVLQLLLLAGNGCLLAAILRRMAPGQPMLAFFTGALYVVYPADEGVFAFRDLGYHQAIFFFLLAVLLLIVHWQRPRFVVLLAMGGSQALALGTYETAVPLALAAPLLLVGLERGINRRLVRVAVLWYVTPLCALMGSLLAMSMKGTYLKHLVSNTTTTGMEWAAVFLKQFKRAYGRHFVDGWRDIWTERMAEPLFLWTACGIALVTAVVGLLHHRTVKPSPASEGNKLGLLFIAAGLAIIPMGYALYVLSPNYWSENERVFLHSAIGGALCVAGGLYLLRRFLRASWPVMAVLASILIGVASYGALLEHYHCVRCSDVEQQLLAGIAEKLPVVDSDDLVLVFCDTAHFSQSEGPVHTAVIAGWFDLAVAYLYKRPALNLVFCQPGSQLFPRSPVFERGGVRLTTQDKVFGYDKVICLRREQSGKVSLLGPVPSEYLPANAPAPQIRGLSPASEPPARVHTLLGSWPYQMPPPADEVVRNNVSLKFNRSVNGNGWSGPSESGTWMCATTATLNTRLATSLSYEVSIGIAMALAPDILESLTLRVNDESIPLTLDRRAGGAGVFSGVIPQSAVLRTPGSTRLAFQVSRVVTPKSLGMNEDPRTLALMFDWLRISPRAR